MLIDLIVQVWYQFIMEGCPNWGTYFHGVYIFYIHQLSNTRSGCLIKLLIPR